MRRLLASAAPRRRRESLINVGGRESRGRRIKPMADLVELAACKTLASSGCFCNSQPKLRIHAARTGRAALGAAQRSIAAIAAVAAVQSHRRAPSLPLQRGERRGRKSDTAVAPSPRSSKQHRRGDRDA